MDPNVLFGIVAGAIAVLGLVFSPLVRTLVKHVFTHPKTETVIHVAHRKVVSVEEVKPETKDDPVAVG